ncbi:hypothetical protein [Bifidobacterium simiarum]|uniref:hypothetical protein n=1 Tax=Bifidobacterium simiarum TaxID=2045441 RepID=UPI001BDD5FF7|nr:hypothetical protein [Bifidobacterium simiarum]MBT1166761.1 hypothetical protein [Bifidobacterium simiarum]
MGNGNIDDDQPFETTERVRWRNRQAREDAVNGRYHSDKGIRDEHGHLTRQPDILFGKAEDGEPADADVPPVRPPVGGERRAYADEYSDERDRQRNVRDEPHPMAEAIGVMIGEVFVQILNDPRVRASLRRTVRHAGERLIGLAGKAKSYVSNVWVARRTETDSRDGEATAVAKTSADGSDTDGEIIEGEIVPDESVTMTSGEFAAKQEEARRLEMFMQAAKKRLARVQHDLDHAIITPEEAGEETTQIVQQLMRELPPSQSLALENGLRSKPFPQSAVGLAEQVQEEVDGVGQ